MGIHDPATIALELLPDLYDGAVNLGRLQTFLDHLQGTLDGYEPAIALRFPGPGREPVMLSAGDVSLGLDSYGSHYHTLDPCAPVLARMGVGELLNTASVMPRDEVDGMEFYNDWMRPCGREWGPSYLASLASSDGDLEASFVVSRCKGAPVLDASGHELLKTLLPHVCRARQLWSLLDEANSTEAVLSEALDRMPLGVLIINAHGRVVWASRIAEDILMACDGLLLRDGRLAAISAGVSRELTRRIDRAVQTSAGHGLDAGGALSLPRASGARPLEALVAPIHREMSLGDLEQSAAAMVFVSDPDERRPAREEVLKAIYGLTDAEARLAVLLARDHSLAEAAEFSGVTIGTARDRLKTVFSKTGTSRQGSLVRLVLRGPASLGRPRED